MVKRKPYVLKNQPFRKDSAVLLLQFCCFIINPVPQLAIQLMCFDFLHARAHTHTCACVCACMHAQFMTDMKQFTNTIFQLLPLVLVLMLTLQHKSFLCICVLFLGLICMVCQVTVLNNSKNGWHMIGSLQYNNYIIIISVVQEIPVPDTRGTKSFWYNNVSMRKCNVKQFQSSESWQYNHCIWYGRTVSTKSQNNKVMILQYLMSGMQETLLPNLECNSHKPLVQLS
jgi:hypothetical protein